MRTALACSHAEDISQLTSTLLLPSPHTVSAATLLQDNDLTGAVIADPHKPAVRRSLRNVALLDYGHPRPVYLSSDEYIIRDAAAIRIVAVVFIDLHIRKAA